MANKKRKSQKIKNRTKSLGKAPHHKKAFLLEVLMYIPLVYIDLIYVIYKFVIKYTIFTVLQVTSHSGASYVWLKNIKINLPQININWKQLVNAKIKLPDFFILLLSPIRLFFKIFRAIVNFEIKVKIFAPKTIFAVSLLMLLYVVSIFYIAILEEIPSPDSLKKYDPRMTTTIYDRKGNVLYRLYDDEDRTLVNLKDIPEDLINATIAIEDQTFYKHKGLSAQGITRAAKRTFFEETLQGGSTITQQLVKNTLLTPERTLDRKIKEAVIAIELERQLSKNQILELYLNNISYGGTAYGIKSAANKYFGKDLSELSLAECTFLAGLPAAPSNYSPFLSGDEKLGKARQREVLRRMAEEGTISAENAKEAYDQELTFIDNTTNITAPHFVNYVISELENEFGQKLVTQGGLEVFTSLDLELQRELEKIVAKNVASLNNNNVSNGAALITNPQTGEILAMVGSANYWDIENDGNVNVTTSPRQPGSSIKPLMYSLALDSGQYSITSIIEDSPITYDLVGSRSYSPRNYDNSFHGKVTLMAALANSYNVPAVKVLETLGVNNFIDHAEKLGISTWTERSRYGLSIALGAGEVKMIDMAEAYGTFANQGEHIDLQPIIKAYDPYGNIITENKCVNLLKESPSILTRRAIFDVSAQAKASETGYTYDMFEAKCQGEQVISPETAYQLSYMLSSNAARSPAFGSNSALNISEKQVAVKTGTTTSVKDNWTIGYSNDYLVTAWVGNNHGESMNDVVSGYRGASIIWKDTWDYIIKNREVADKISRPAGIIEVDICPLTNTLACAGCPNIQRIYRKGEEPKYACTREQIESILNPKDDEEEKEESED